MFWRNYHVEQIWPYVWKMCLWEKCAQFCCFSPALRLAPDFPVSINSTLCTLAGSLCSSIKHVGVHGLLTHHFWAKPHWPSDPMPQLVNLNIQWKPQFFSQGATWGSFRSPRFVGYPCLSHLELGEVSNLTNTNHPMVKIATLYSYCGW